MAQGCHQGPASLPLGTDGFLALSSSGQKDGAAAPAIMSAQPVSPEADTALHMTLWRRKVFSVPRLLPQVPSSSPAPSANPDPRFRALGPLNVVHGPDGVGWGETFLSVSSRFRFELEVWSSPQGLEDTSFLCAFGILKPSRHLSGFF